MHCVACRLQGAVQSDSGLYQCQVSTTPILARDVWLAVLGGWNGSTETVQCCIALILSALIKNRRKADILLN